MTVIYQCRTATIKVSVVRTRQGCATILKRFRRKGEPMDKQRIVRPIIKNRLIYIYNPDPIRFFFFWHKPDGLLIANFRFRVRYNRCNSKNLNKLHILIRSPLFCIERNNGGTTIGNKYQLFFVKHRVERRTDETD